MIYRLSLNSREAAVVYAALTKVEWFGADVKAALDVRTSIEKIGVKKTSRSLHDLLVATEGISGSEKPDIRTMKEKIDDFYAQAQRGEQR